MTRDGAQLPGDLFFRSGRFSLLTIVVARPSWPSSLLSVDANQLDSASVSAVLQALSAPSDAKLICRDSATI